MTLPMFMHRRGSADYAALFYCLPGWLRCPSDLPLRLPDWMVSLHVTDRWVMQARRTPFALVIELLPLHVPRLAQDHYAHLTISQPIPSCPQSQLDHSDGPPRYPFLLLLPPASSHPITHYAPWRQHTSHRHPKCPPRSCKAAASGGPYGGARSS